MSARFGCRLCCAAVACVAVACGLLSMQPVQSRADPCTPVTVGLDASQANTSASPFLGEAPGQTFMARDTLIRSLTVWRVAVEDTNLYGMHLYFTNTDSTGTPLVNQIVINGPTVYNPYGDGIHPIPFQFVFESPVGLPRPGEYAFFIAITPCIPGGYFDILGRMSTADLYPDGHFWWTGRSATCSLHGLKSNPVADLCFEIEFCHAATTPVRRQTWGQLKQRYR